DSVQPLSAWTAGLRRSAARAPQPDCPAHGETGGARVYDHEQFRSAVWSSWIAARPDAAIHTQSRIHADRAILSQRAGSLATVVWLRREKGSAVGLGACPNARACELRSGCICSAHQWSDRSNSASQFAGVAK